MESSIEIKKFELPRAPSPKLISEILGVSGPAVSQMLSKQYGNTLSNGKRIDHIPRNVVYDLLSKKKKNYFYRKNIFLSHTVVGGSAKTSFCWNIFNAFLRLCPSKNPCILISADSQSSLDMIAMGQIITNDSQKILVDYFSGNAKIDEILLPLNKDENIWIIPSNLRNLYYEDYFKSKEDVKSKALNLIEDIYSFFPGTNPTIVIDTAPAISNVIHSFALALVQLQEIYSNDEFNAVLCIPLRTDETSLKGCEIAYEELKKKIDEHTLKKFPDFRVFIANFDRRLLLSKDILKRLFKIQKYKDHVSTTAIRTSSQIPKLSQINKSLFHGVLQRQADQDYHDLLLELLECNRKA